MPSNSFELLIPAVITRVMEQTQDVLTLPGALAWYNRANKPNVSDNEMILQSRMDIYASDIVAMNAPGHLREAGEYSFRQFGSNKLKHGAHFDEEMIKLWLRLSMPGAMDSEAFSFRAKIGQIAEALETGRRQRAEAMLNGMLFADAFNYDRLGIKISGGFGMRPDLKFTPSESWRNTDGTVNTDATPLADMIATLFYALLHYGESYDRITLTLSALQAIIGTDEFKETYKAQAFTYQQGSGTANIDALAGAPGFFLNFIANFVSAGLTTLSGNQASRPVTIEVTTGQYREYAANGTRGTLYPFHPGISTVGFTNSMDDGKSTGWDLGNGQCVEAAMGGLLAGMGVSLPWMSFDGMSPWGPLGYVAPDNFNMNPPGFQMWNVGWNAPRKLRDTCSAFINAWPV